MAGTQRRDLDSRVPFTSQAQDGTGKHTTQGLRLVQSPSPEAHSTSGAVQGLMIATVRVTGVAALQHLSCALYVMMYDVPAGVTWPVLTAAAGLPLYEMAATSGTMPS